MTRSRARITFAVAWLGWLVCLALAIGGALTLVAHDGRGEAATVISVVVAAAGVGVALIAARGVGRNPQEPVSWVLLALALFLEAAIASDGYVSYARASDAALPVVEAAAVIHVFAFPAVVLFAPFTLLVGSGLRRARALIVLLAAASGAALVALALSPGPLPAYPSIENPLGVGAFATLGAYARSFWPLVAAATAVLGVGAAVARGRRRADHEQERPGAWHVFPDFPRVLPYLRPYSALGALAVALLGVAVLMGLLSPWPLAILIDTVLGKKPLPSLLGFLGEWSTTALLLLAVIGGLAITTIENGVGVIQSYVNTKLEQRMALDVRSDLFRHAQGLSQAWHDNARTGNLMYAINNQAHAVGAVTVAIPPLFQALATLVGMLLIAFRIDPELALIAMSVVPFIYWSTRYYSKHIEPRLYDVRNMEAQSLSIVHEAMAMLRVIVSFGRQKHEYTRFRSQAERAVDARVDVTVRETIFSLAVNVSTALGTALVLGFGAWHVLQGELSAGELLVVMAYIAAVYQPLEQITGTVANLQEQFIGMRMALDLLDTEPEIKDAPDALELEHVGGHVTFEHVSFSYVGREDTLSDVAFDASPGTRIGIVGRTGAGKTTIVQLIPRFYDVAEGRVLIDGHDVRNVTLDSLREQISIVHQQPMLFSGTIEDNIRYGRLEATDEEIVEAAHAANAHEFVSALPLGYATVLGEGGAQLSGGERQRISIARAFLKDAPILILDEPTASIDSKTESVILEALERLAIGRTTFIVAHRLATLGDPDVILVIDGGRIAERGTRDDLLASDGLFRQFYDAQTMRSRRLRVVEPAETPAPDVQGPAPDGPKAENAELIAALRTLLDARAELLTRIAADGGQPVEARVAAGMLAVLAREDLKGLQNVDDARLEELLRTRR